MPFPLRQNPRSNLFRKVKTGFMGHAEHYGFLIFFSRATYQQLMSLYVCERMEQPIEKTDPRIVEDPGTPQPQTPAGNPGPKSEPAYEPGGEDMPPEGPQPPERYPNPSQPQEPFDRPPVKPQAENGAQPNTQPRD